MFHIGTYFLERIRICIGIAIARGDIRPEVDSHVIQSYTLAFANDALLTAAVDLEGVATVQVDGRTAPDLGGFTLTAAKHVEGCAEHVHTLLA